MCCVPVAPTFRWTPTTRTRRAEAIWESAGACGVLQDELSFAPRGPIGDRLAPAGAGREETAQDDAWIIFTSGSTGAPKGVAVSHRAAAAFVDAEARLWTVDPEDRVLAGLSVCFDASCEEMWLAWANGAALVPAPRALIRTGVDLGPVAGRARRQRGLDGPDARRDVGGECSPGCGSVILGGEACPRARVAARRRARGVEHLRADRGDRRQHGRTHIPVRP